MLILNDYSTNLSSLTGEDRCCTYSIHCGIEPFFTAEVTPQGKEKRWCPVEVCFPIISKEAVEIDLMYNPHYFQVEVIPVDIPEGFKVKLYSESLFSEAESLKQGLNEKLLMESYPTFIDTQSQLCTLDDGEGRKTFFINLLKQSKSDQSCQNLLINLIMILNRAGFCFSELDLSEIRIPKADLSYALLDSVNFSGADLTGVNLTGAWLRNSNLTSAKLENIWFGEELSEFYGAATSLAYNRDGSLLAAGCRGGKIYIITNIESREKLRQKYDTEKIRSITDLFFGDSNKLLAAGHTGKILYCFDVFEKTMLANHELKDYASVVVFNKKGSACACGSVKGGVFIWQLSTNEIKEISVQINSEVTAFCFSQNDKNLICGLKNGQIVIFNALEDAILGNWNQNHILFFHQDKVIHISDQDNDQFFSSSTTSLKIWKTNSISAAPILVPNLHFTSCCFSSLTKQLALGTKDGKIFTVNSRGFTVQQVTNQHKKDVTSICFNPSGNSLASGSMIDGYFRIRSLKQSKSSLNLSKITALAFNASMTLLATASENGTVIVWQSPSGDKRAEGTTRARLSTHLYFESDHNLILISPFDRKLYKWNINNQQETEHVFDPSTETKHPHVTSNGETVFSVSNNINVFNIKDGSSTNYLTNRERNVISITTDGNAEKIGIAYNNGQIELWESSIQLNIKKIKNLPARKLLFNAQGTSLAVLLQKDIQILDDTLNTIYSFKIDSFPEAVDFSQDGELLALSAEDGYINIHTISANACTAFRAHLAIVELFKFSSSATQLVSVGSDYSGGADHSLRLWSISHEKKGAIRISLIWSTHRGILCLDGTRLNKKDFDDKMQNFLEKNKAILT